MIAAVTAIRNEVDIIEANVRHLLENGVDQILVSDQMSTDGTRELLLALSKEFPGSFGFISDPRKVFYQYEVMNKLVRAVHYADWVIPFDADEFVYAPRTGDIAAALARVPAEVHKLFMTPYLHLDWHRRVVNNQRLHKVAFRQQPNLDLEMGNHDVHGGPDAFATDVLALREWQFRSFDHFCRKVALNIETRDPSLPANQAVQYRALEGLSAQEMEAKWQHYLSQPTVDDPVPSSFLPSTVTT